MNDWQYAGAWAYVILGGAVILGASIIGRPVDASAITVHGLISTYVLNQARVRRSERRDKEGDDD